MIELFKHQQEVLDETKDMNRVAYYLDMGLGKTYVGAEKAMQLDEKITLVVCLKSLVPMWVNHFREHYDVNVIDLTENIEEAENIEEQTVMVVNYDLIFRRDLFKELEGFTLLLDESSVIQNKTAKRTKSVLQMKAKNVILLSGTPTSGKYENLWTQAHLLGWGISEDLYNRQYVNWETVEAGGFYKKIPNKDDPYKNVERLKRKLRRHGAVFMKTDEVFDLPKQTFTEIKVDNIKLYREFEKHKYVTLPNGDELIGDNTLTHRLYLRMLASGYNKNKIQAYQDLLNQTNDRLIVFYNFNEELEQLLEVTDRPTSIVNGQLKDLTNYEEKEDSVTFIQYQAGSMGLNLQKANKIIYFSLTEKSELYEQSKKRIHRIGQERPCFYYVLMAKNSIDQKILRNLKMRRDYTDELFEEDYGVIEQYE